MFLFTETFIATSVFIIIIGIHDNKASRDMRIKVFVNRRLCKALFAVSVKTYAAFPIFYKCRYYKRK